MMLASYAKTSLLLMISSFIAVSCSGGAGFSGKGGLAGIGGKGAEKRSAVRQDGTVVTEEGSSSSTLVSSNEDGQESDDGKIKDSEGNDIGVVIPDDTTGFRLLTVGCTSSGLTPNVTSIGGDFDCRFAPSFDPSDETVFTAGDEIVDVKKVEIKLDNEKLKNNAEALTLLNTCAAFDSKKFKFKMERGRKDKPDQFQFSKEDQSIGFSLCDSFAYKAVKEVKIEAKVLKDTPNGFCTVDLKFRKMIASTSLENLEAVEAFFETQFELEKNQIEDSWRHSDSIEDGNILQQIAGGLRSGDHWSYNRGNSRSQNRQQFRLLDKRDKKNSQGDYESCKKLFEEDDN